MVWRQNIKSHDKSLTYSFERASKTGFTITINIKKCRFQKKLIYLGHKLSKDGKSADENKIRNITKMPTSNNRKDIQRLLGMINYVAKFIPNLSNITEPLRELLQKETHWQWEKRYNQTVKQIKTLLKSRKCFAYFDVKKPVNLQVDACKKRLGAEN